MKKYILTSDKFQGQVTFGYDANGDLVFYNNEIPEPKVIKWMNRYIPADESELAVFKGKVSATIQEIPEDLTFDRFWEAYDKKVNRKRAEPLWDKLNDAKKLQAIMKIKTYFDYCTVKRRGIADPEKWLRDRLFETDWYNLK